MGGRPPALVTCVGCGGDVPEVQGATHEYMLSSPGCWRLYGQWAAERAWSGQVGSVVAAHHVDCYAIQHPGNAVHDRRQRQSIAVHLTSLCLLLEFGQPPQDAMRSRARTGATVLAALGLDDWPLLHPPHYLGAMTIADVAATVDPNGAEEAFVHWAQEGWNAWSAHHTTVREWAAALLGSR